MKKVEAYKTTDGEIFTNELKAKKHQKVIDDAAAETEKYKNYESYEFCIVVSQKFKKYICAETDKGEEEAKKIALENFKQEYGNDPITMHKYCGWGIVGDYFDIQVEDL